MINNNVIESVDLSLFGRHNIYNALAAISVAMSKGILLKHILNALKSFNGVKRRMELKYKANEILLFDDYAHHPTEIITTLEGIYKSHPKHRIITVFQPHRYSRLTNLFDAFSVSFNRSNKTFILPVFTAGEIKSKHKDATDLVATINQNNNEAIYCESFEFVLNELNQYVQANDIILLMGAGNVTTISKKIISIIKKKRD